MPPFFPKRAQKKPASPAPTSVWDSFKPATPTLSEDERRALSEGALAGLTRNAAGIENAGFAPGTGVVPSETLLRKWEGQS